MLKRNLDTPENRAFWRAPEPPLPKSKATRKALAALKRETALRVDRLIDDETLTIAFRDVTALRDKLRTEADALDGGG